MKCSVGAHFSSNSLLCATDETRLTYTNSECRATAREKVVYKFVVVLVRTYIAETNVLWLDVLVGRHTSYC